MRRNILDSNTVSERFNILKVLSILSVIMAHSRKVNLGWVSYATEVLGALGVVIFFIIAGYYFNLNKYGYAIFFKRKIQTIIIPWVFTGSILFLVGNEFTVLRWLNWLAGNGSYLYYLTILIILYVLFGKIQNRNVLFLLIVLNICSLIYTNMFLLPTNTLITNYLNPLNWVGFFSIGVLLQKQNSLLVTVDRYSFLFPFLFLVFCIVGYKFEPNYGGYFSKLAFFIEITGAGSLFLLSKYLLRYSSVFNKAADLSFTIYLVHFLFFPLRKYLLHGIINEFINPIIYLIVIIIAIQFGQILARKFRLEKFYNLLLGSRTRMIVKKA